ncbi:hypothetical protein [Sphingobacterium sp. SYP-B4668]|uniref:hypothetical protein n=1 Tax=Sphingobacterium sp. SYP-B4668 TaxID=2996035 RepID=UPI0022DDC243|nr:hypothetical protein [Sphingobacterium sp. SYP-B4668]
MKKRNYVPPVIEVCFIETEEGIAAGSVVSIGGTDNLGQPDIFDQEVEEKKYDLEF